MNQTLVAISAIENWVSPRLGIRFDLSGAELELYHPDGQPFLSYTESSRQATKALAELELERQRADRLAAQLRSLGIEPE